MPRGPNGEVRPADMNQRAKCIVDLATGQTSEEELVYSLDGLPDELTFTPTKGVRRWIISPQ